MRRISASPRLQTGDRHTARYRRVRIETTRLVGFCLLIHRAVVDAIGGFDESFGIGNFEDDDLCRRAFDDFQPDVLLTYGGDAATAGMMGWARSRGARVLFGLHNFAYHDAAWFRAVDRVLVPSEYSRDAHRSRLGLETYVLPYVLHPDRVLAPRRAPRFVTMINPQPTKGLAVFAAIARRFHETRPGIPLLVVEGRGQSDALRQVPLDLRSVRNLHQMPNRSDPRDFYEVTKILLVPSLWEESFGLVAAEAMANGIPVLASDRGALPEVIQDAGFVFHMPRQYEAGANAVPEPVDIEPWVRIILRLFDEPAWCEAISLRAAQHACQWFPNAVRSTYEQVFMRHRDGHGEKELSENCLT